VHDIDICLSQPVWRTSGKHAHSVYCVAIENTVRSYLLRAGLSGVDGFRWLRMTRHRHRVTWLLLFFSSFCFLYYGKIGVTLRVSCTYIPCPWLSRNRSHDRQVSYLDSVLEPPRCRLARALYMEPQIREAHSTLLVLQNQAHNALAKPSPSDLGAERPETFPKDVATQRINYPRRLATRSSGEPAASWRWHPRR